MLGALQGRADRVGPFWQILIRLPGTLLHETAHLLVAFLTGGRPSSFTIVPRRTITTSADGSVRQAWVLGSVTLSNPSIISAFPSGLAPLLLLPSAWLLYRNWFTWFTPDLTHTLLMYVTVVVCIGSSLPSSHDLSVAFSRPVGVLLYALLAAGCLMLRGL